MNDAREAIGQYFGSKNKAWLAKGFDEFAAQSVEVNGVDWAVKETSGFRQLNDRRGLVQQKSDMGIVIEQMRISPNEDRATVLVTEQMLWLYNLNDEMEEEQRSTLHKLALRLQNGQWIVVSDVVEVETFGFGKRDPSQPLAKMDNGDAWITGEGVVVRPELLGSNRPSTLRNKSVYNRLAAVRYAELWWNSYNPNYRKFDVDCTNYTSQCLHAGGAPFVGGGTRDKGWWYRSGSEGGWSYSWAVVHSFRWFLASGSGGWHATELGDPRQLKVGDIICYDWNGDGHWQHSTIVIDFDATGMPLVNAHTVNSRRRYWDYSDSYAYSANTRYTFFHIPDMF